jgi:two-component system, sensor histidine kinase and response regulator
MKTAAKEIKVIPAGLRKAVKILEELHDILLLYSAEGEEIYCSNTVNRPEGVTEYMKSPSNIYLISKGKHHKIFSSGHTRMDAVFSFIESGSAKFIVCAISRCTQISSGLLWDAFIQKNNIYYSQTAETLTGYTSDELNKLSGKAFNLLSEEDSEEVKSKISSFIVNKNNELEIIYPLTTKTGRQIWLREYIIAVRDNKNNIYEYESSLVDITSFIEEKKEIDVRLKDLDQINREKDQFISVLSHDLKSPYTSILGFSEILLNENTLTPEERAEYLSYINLSSQTQLKLINNLLEWSRLITGRRGIESCKINVKNLVSSVISNNTRSICKKNLDVKVVSDNYIFAEADERLLNEVLNIIVSNAVKFSYNEKVIEIFINFFRDNQVEVIVKDEGSGISEKNKGRLLKIDQIFSTPGTAGERGTGISLLLANEIIKAHKGELWFYSEEGRGTEFHFTIPASGNLILFISNNETEKLKIANMVKSGFPEFKFMTVSNFYDAINITGTVNPSIIITTHLLPLMNGIEFLKNIRSDPKYALTPVLVSSGEINNYFEEEYKRLGVYDILSEPVNLITLKTRIEENLK